jgi:hypothetical protein
MTAQGALSIIEHGMAKVSCLPEISQQGWTPMMRQYLLLRRQANALLAYQMGDFCEFFFDDALIVSRICDVALTARGTAPDGTAIQMCALPKPRGLKSSSDGCVTALWGCDYLYSHLLQAGYPLAFAVEAGVVGGMMKREIMARFESTGRVSE